MEQQLKQKLNYLASLSRTEVGENENNVKQKFIIPFLECYGYNQFEFEYSAQGSRIDIFIKSNTQHNIVVEAKGYDKNLIESIDQLKKYCDSKRPIIAILSNGFEILFFAPLSPIQNFSDTIIYSFKRNDFKDEKIIERIEKVLSKTHLENETIDDEIRTRQKEIRNAKKEIQTLQETNRKKTVEIENLNKDLDDQIKTLNDKIQTNNNDIKELSGNLGRDIIMITENYLLPSVIKSTIPPILPILPGPLPLNSVKFTRVLEGKIDNENVNSWGKLLQAAIRIANRKGYTIEHLQNILTCLLCEGSPKDNTYRKIEGTNIFLQGMNADNSLKNATIIANKLSLTVRVIFEYEQNPGQRERIEIN